MPPGQATTKVKPYTNLATADNLCVLVRAAREATPNTCTVTRRTDGVFAQAAFSKKLAQNQTHTTRSRKYTLPSVTSARWADGRVQFNRQHARCFNPPEVAWAPPDAGSSPGHVCLLYTPGTNIHQAEAACQSTTRGEGRKCLPTAAEGLSPLNLERYAPL
ncbi:hypothetical protein Bbelb_103950 [Branchiostoma belcheri]|nr:hypothetical protein Bbelb_103950 [Branchiostoma belcheri]